MVKPLRPTLNNFNECKVVLSTKSLRTAGLHDFNALKFATCFMAQHVVNISKNSVPTWKKCVRCTLWVHCMCTPNHTCILEVKLSNLLTRSLKSSTFLLTEICHYLKRKTLLNVGLTYPHFSLFLWILTSQIFYCFSNFPVPSNSFSMFKY